MEEFVVPLPQRGGRFSYCYDHHLHTLPVDRDVLGGLRSGTHTHMYSVHEQDGEDSYYVCRRGIVLSGLCFREACYTLLLSFFGISDTLHDSTPPVPSTSTTGGPHDTAI